MYYLDSRYYHPLLCRFITPDSYEYIDINNIKTFNLYAYCNNDPINYADPEGDNPEWWQWVLSRFVVFLFGGLAGSALGIATTSDISLIENGVVGLNEKGTKINNSCLIVTPWVRYFYSLNIKYNSNANIKGTALGLAYEWKMHNLAHKLSILCKRIGIDSIFGVDINEILSQYNHNKKIIYYDGQAMYFNNLKVMFPYNVLFIDDSSLIYANGNSIYYIDSNGDINTLFITTDNIDYSSIKKVNSEIIYKRKEDIYVSYNLINKKNVLIDENIYYKMRDKNRYKLTFNENNNTIKVDDKVVDNKLFFENDIYKKINEIEYLQMKDYNIVDDNLFLHFFVYGYEITFRYDFNKELIEFYDWIFINNSKCIRCYMLSNSLEYPVLHLFK